MVISQIYCASYSSVLSTVPCPTAAHRAQYQTRAALRGPIYSRLEAKLNRYYALCFLAPWARPDSIENYWRENGVAGQFLCTVCECVYHELGPGSSHKRGSTRTRASLFIWGSRSRCFWGTDAIASLRSQPERRSKTTQKKYTVGGVRILPFEFRDIRMLIRSSPCLLQVTNCSLYEQPVRMTFTPATSPLSRSALIGERGAQSPPPLEHLWTVVERS